MVVNRTAGCRTLAAGIDKSHNLYLILERFLIHDLFSDVTWFSNLSLSPWSKRTQFYSLVRLEFMLEICVICLVFLLNSPAFIAKKICLSLGYPTFIIVSDFFCVQTGWWLDSRVRGAHFCDRERCRSWSPSSSAQTGSDTLQIILGGQPNACAIQYAQRHVICSPVLLWFKRWSASRNYSSAKADTSSNSTCSATCTRVATAIYFSE
jgi:hypothetical protein